MRGFFACTVVVLAAIAIGVGAEAAFAPTVYGPPGYRFVAAFPAPPRVHAFRFGSTRVWLYTERTGSAQYSVGIITPGGRSAARALESAERATCPDPGACGGWVGYAPLEAPPGQPAIELDGLRARVLLARGISDGRRAYVADANLPSRAVWWSIAAVGPKAPVEAFMESVTTVP